MKCTCKSAVGRWDRFEACFENRKNYTDPYRDVTLNVSCASPDGRVFNFYGFYSGERLWKFRFMPDAVGTWTYKAWFSDNTPAGEGSFECVDSDIPGLIGKDEANPIWFGFKGGKHTFIRSFHAGDRFFASNWPQSARLAFLDWAAEMGYNTLSIASFLFKRDEKGRGRDWDVPALWDGKNPVCSEYDRLEVILDLLAERRFIVFPFAGFFGKSSNFPREKEDQDVFLKYTLARLGSYWNLLYTVAGPEPLLSRQPFMQKDEIRRLAEEIRKLDIYGHLLSVHNQTGDDDFYDEDYISFVTLQGPKTLVRGELSRGILFNRRPGMPLYAQETLWANNKYHPAYTKDDIRKNAYVLIMSGAAINFADNNGDSSSGFSGTLDINDADLEKHMEIKKVWDFFETLPFYRMKPAPELVSRGYCLADEGREYLVYLENGENLSVNVKEGEYDATWIKASDTADRRDAGTRSTFRNLWAPDNENDWLLHLIRV